MIQGRPSRRRCQALGIGSLVQSDIRREKGRTEKRQRSPSHGDERGGRPGIASRRGAVVDAGSKQAPDPSRAPASCKLFSAPTLRHESLNEDPCTRE